MTTLLASAAIILLTAAILGLINEKTIQITDEIALLLFSILMAFCILCLKKAGIFDFNGTISQFYQGFDLNHYLVQGVLCFMLFAGASHVRLSGLRRDAKLITSLSLLSTLIGAVCYGLLFFGVSSLLHIGLTLPVCLLLGSIISPTDPIAATSILRKFGLPERTGFVIEAESLFNDGVGVALFVCFSGMVTQEGGAGFFSVLLRELCGAVAVGLVVSFLVFQLFRRTKDEYRRILFSLGAVMLSYAVCEACEFSGAIAAVVCGIYFATAIDRLGGAGEIYESFWGVIDNLLNSVLYVIIGCFFAYALEMPFVLLLTLASILINLAARFASVAVSAAVNRPLPDGFGVGQFSALLTWGGLRGGLCLALALSTATMLPEQSFHIVVGCAYVTAFFTTAVQGLTMKRVYQRIRR